MSYRFQAQRRKPGRAQTYNPPGRPALEYRVGDFLSFYQEMLASINVTVIPGGRLDPNRVGPPLADESGDGKLKSRMDLAATSLVEPGPDLVPSPASTALGGGSGVDGVLAGLATRFRPLARLNIEEAQNWVVGLMQCWAVVGDVLAFYQERLINEGYLRTATQDLSILELVRALDYRPAPGIASTTYLAFSVAEEKTSIRRVLVPRGTRVLSLPPQGGQQQTFETVEEIQARLEWNALKPRVRTEAQPVVLSTDVTSLALRGLATGLRPGSVLLIVGDLKGAEDPAQRTYLRHLTGVETEVGQGPGSGSTLASWVEPLEPRGSGGELTQVRVFHLALQTQLFGYNAPDWTSLTPEAQRRYEHLKGGVQLSTDAGKSFREAMGDLPASPIRSLAATPSGAFFVATKDGLFRSLDRGISWQRAGQMVGRMDLTALYVGESGLLLAGGAEGEVYRSTDEGESWQEVSGRLFEQLKKRSVLHEAPTPWAQLPKTAVRSFATLTHRGHTSLYAGTDNGVFCVQQQGDSWQPLNRGLPELDKKTGLTGLPVRALSWDAAHGLLFAGTDRGVYRSRDRGRHWHPANRGVPGTNYGTGASTTKILALTAYTDARAGKSYAFAGSDQGIYVSTDRGRHWKGVEEGPKTAAGLPATVRILARAVDESSLSSELYAGTDDGLFRTPDHGKTWQAVAGEPGSTRVLAAAVNGDGSLLAGTEIHGFAKNWPGFFIQDGVLDLNGVHPQVVPGSWVALTQSLGKLAPRVGIHKALSVESAYREDFSLAGTVTRVRVAPDSRQALFDLRETVVLAESEALEMMDELRVRLEPLAPERIILDRVMQEVPAAGRRVVVAGKLLRVVFRADVTGTIDGREAPVTAGEEMRVLVKQENGPNVDLELVRADGAHLKVETPRSDLRWRPARSDDPPESELTTLVGTESISERTSREWATVLVVGPPLRTCFDPATVSLYVNIAEATQGETVPAEVLGSGDPAAAFQSFTLKKPPLTFVRSPSGKGFASTLEVRVNGVRWKEIANLEGAEPGDQVYLVRFGQDGRPLVIFGDGSRGARLPAGVENVLARYRSGMWTRSVEAGRVKLLQTQPQGIAGAFNPMTTDPGVPEESLRETRRRAPVSTGALERIVSLRDYQDFALTFPGIVKAQVARLQTDLAPVVQVTVAPESGQPLAADSPTLHDLELAIRRARTPIQGLIVSSFEPLFFRLEARVQFDPRYRPVDVEARVRQVLRRAFDFEQSAFDQKVLSSEVVGLIQSVPGVVALDLDALYTGDEPHLRASLYGSPARWVDGEAYPAQLIMVDPEGISLTLVEEL